LLLQRDKGVDLRHATIGIVGCGHVGSKVRSLSQRLGLRVLVCDPPLAAKESTNTPRNATLSKREHPTPRFTTCAVRRSMPAIRVLSSAMARSI
jgi:lactate dehydrogenase-like 2-hydroxyacid dehydrogenase